MPPAWQNSQNALPELAQMNKFDALVVGYGLAGACLTEILLEKGFRVIVIDDGFAQASRVGAGIVNPFIFRHMTLSWRVQELLPAALSFYRKLEHHLQLKFVHPFPILRLFGQGESQRWKEKGFDPGEGCRVLSDENSKFPYLLADHGMGLVEQSFRVDTGLLIFHLRQRHQKRAVFVQEEFDVQQVVIESKGLLYKNMTAERIIFCEGFKAVRNPFFGFIPFRPVKGELLTLKVPGMQEDTIVNKEVFLLPLGNEFFRLGSTYDWDDLTELPTEDAARHLLSGFRKITMLPFEIVGHEAGIRPAVADRRAVAGSHPEHDRIFILNGLGARGALIAPWLVSYLAGRIGGEQIPDMEVDPGRFLNRQRKQS
jgi:glycine oxidase